MMLNRLMLLFRDLFEADVTRMTARRMLIEIGTAASSESALSVGTRRGVEETRGADHDSIR